MIYKKNLVSISTCIHLFKFGELSAWVQKQEKIRHWYHLINCSIWNIYKLFWDGSWKVFVFHVTTMKMLIIRAFVIVKNYHVLENNVLFKVQFSNLIFITLLRTYPCNNNRKLRTINLKLNCCTFYSQRTWLSRVGRFYR